MFLQKRGSGFHRNLVHVLKSSWRGATLFLFLAGYFFHSVCRAVFNQLPVVLPWSISQKSSRQILFRGLCFFVRSFLVRFFRRGGNGQWVQKVAKFCTHTRAEGALAPKAQAPSTHHTHRRAKKVGKRLRFEFAVFGFSGGRGDQDSLPPGVKSVALGGRWRWSFFNRKENGRVSFFSEAIIFRFLP